MSFHNAGRSTDSTARVVVKKVAWAIALIAFLTAAFALANPRGAHAVQVTGNATSYLVYNVSMHYGFNASVDVVGSQSKVLGAKGFKSSTKFGQLVPVQGGKGLQLKLLKGERVVSAFYDYWYDGQNAFHQSRWNGKGTLQIRSKPRVHGLKTLKVVTDVYVLAYVPHHSPYEKVPLKMR